MSELHGSDSTSRGALKGRPWMRRLLARAGSVARMKPLDA